MTIAKFCDLWCSGVESGEGHPYKRYRNCNVYVDGRTIYSWGEHFPMGHILAPNVVWLNGDTVSASTSRHQRLLRDKLRWRKSVQVIIVPGSALSAARLDYRTIQPVDIRAEGYEYTRHTSDTPPAGMRTDDIAVGRWSAEEKVHAAFGAHGWAPWRQAADLAVGWIDTEGNRQVVAIDEDGRYVWHTCRHWLGDAVFTAERGGWNGREYEPQQRRPFISSFDRQERNNLYFLSQLPHPVDTVEEAIEALAPESVKTAREMGRLVVRQGDMFAILMGVTTRQLRKQGAEFIRRHVTVEWVGWAKEVIAQRKAIEAVSKTMPPAPVREYGSTELWRKWCAEADAWADELAKRCAAKYPQLWPNGASRHNMRPTTPSRRWHTRREVEAMPLMGTAHTATEVATMPNGMQYARGLIYHDPAVINETRQPDHARRQLGKQWHLIARNTVPVSGR